MDWAEPVTFADGTQGTRLEFRFARIEGGHWLYLTNVGQDVALLRIAKDGDGFTLFSQLVKPAPEAQDAAATFRRCPSAGS